MDFSWEDEQKALRDAAVEFASKRLVDGVIDRDRQAAFSHELWQACADFGLQGMLVSKKWGGGGHSLLDMIAVLEGIGFGGKDNGLVFSVGAHASACEGPLSAFGSMEQQQTWLPGLVDGSTVAATAITEPNAGSDVYAIETRAEKDGLDYVLNGSKTFVTNAPIADLFLIYARTGEPGLFGITCFLVPQETHGIEIGPDIQKSGLRTSPMAEVFLSDCRVPETNILGSAGSGGMVFGESIELERLLVLAPAIGAMERLLERCVDHARTRRVGGVPIGKNQAVSHRIAEMELRLESSRLMLYRAAWKKMNRRQALRDSALAKLALSEAYVYCSQSAVQIFGGYGYTVEYELERELRDATASTLYVGTSEIQRTIIAKTRGL